MELQRSQFYYYIRDAWNLLDLTEITLIITTVSLRFRWLINAPEVNGNVILGYPDIAIVADGIFAFVPIITILRLLMMLRINRQIGILQISFGKMIPDLFTWGVLILTVLNGYGAAFYLFSSSVLSRRETTECNGSWLDSIRFIRGDGDVFFAGYFETMGQLFWIMTSGPDDEALQACFDWSPFLYGVAFLLQATFSLLVIIVLVNLLIAMMGKTHDSVVEAGVREREWLFYKTSVYIKFMRREFVAPAPVNLLPNFYRHLADPNHSFWARLTKRNKPNAVQGLGIGQLELLPEEQRIREKKYKNIADNLVKRYQGELLKNNLGI